MDKTLRRRIELRDRVLKYFDAPDGRPVRGMGDDPVFQGYQETELAEMRLALTQAGLILLISGSGHGAHYQTTDDGVIFLKAIDDYAISDD